MHLHRPVCAGSQINAHRLALTSKRGHSRRHETAGFGRRDTTFKPPDYEFRFVPAIQFNRAQLQEVRGVNVDPRHGKTRNECLMRLRRALDELVVGGIETTIPLFQHLVRENDIIDGNYNIHWLEKYLAKKGA